MARPSKARRLPAEIREAIADLREEGHTLDEIMAHLRQMVSDPDALPSRSGLGRHIQGLDKIAERIRRSRAMAEGIVKQVGKAPESKQARLNIEIMHSVVTDLFTDDDNPVTLTPTQIMALCKALDHLAHAAKGDADMVLKIRQETAKKTKVAAAAEAEKIGHEKGLTAATIDDIKRRILGVRDNA